MTEHRSAAISITRVVRVGRTSLLYRLRDAVSVAQKAKSKARRAYSVSCTLASPSRPSAAHDLCRSPALHYSCAATRHVPHTTPTSVPASQDAWRRVLEHRGGQCPIMRKWRPPSIWGLCAPCAAEGGQLGRSAVNLCHLACCALGGSIDSTPVAMLSTLTPPTPCSPPHALGVSVANLYPVGRGGRPHLPACAGAGCG